MLIGVKPDKTKEQATYVAKERLFKAHYAEHERKRLARGELAPEAVGKEEAKRIIDLERNYQG